MGEEYALPMIKLTMTFFGFQMFGWLHSVDPLKWLSKSSVSFHVLYELGAASLNLVATYVINYKRNNHSNDPFFLEPSECLLEIILYLVNTF